MAVIVKKGNRLKYKRNLMVFLSFTSVFICIEMFYFKVYHFSILMFIVSLFLSSKSIIFSSGIRGEDRVRSILIKLSNDYKILNDIKVYSDTRFSEIDHLVVSEKGIFCIETKNHRGKIFSTNNSKWIQIKQSKKGKSYKNEFYNPVRQVMGHVYCIKKALEQEGIENIFIQPIVVFSSEDIQLNVESKIPVITQNELYDYINRYNKIVYKGKKYLPNKVQNDICRIIKKRRLKI